MTRRNKNMRILNLTVDSETHEVVQKLRKDMSINISELVRRLLKEYYENNKVNKM